jgi:hypothetical protein
VGRITSPDGLSIVGRSATGQGAPHAEGQNGLLVWQQGREASRLT